MGASLHSETYLYLPIVIAYCLLLSAFRLFPKLLPRGLQSLDDLPFLSLFLQKEDLLARIAIFLLSFFYF